MVVICFLLYYNDYEFIIYIKKIVLNKNYYIIILLSFCIKKDRNKKIKSIEKLMSTPDCKHILIFRCNFELLVAIEK